jgi:hypothetical protein
MQPRSLDFDPDESVGIRPSFEPKLLFSLLALLAFKLRWNNSASDTLNFIRRRLDSATAGTQYNYALLLDGGFVVVVAFNNIEKNNRCATTGYWLAKSGLM